MFRDEVEALLARYAECIDAGDFDGVGELFPDGSLSGPDGKPFARGKEQVATFFRSNTILYDGSPRTKHLVTNIAIDESALTARSSCLVLQAAPDGSLQPIITGRYDDTFVRDAEGRLRFKDRRFSVDVTGDLSRHLRRMP
jgi:3-phenylpropionate/cinnamic acid dioxygenase small subunit